MNYGVSYLGGLELSSAPLLFAVGRQARDHGSKLFEHLRPAKLGTLKRLIAPRLGDVEARVLENEARAVAVRLESVGHPRIFDWSAGRPREREPAGPFALQDLATHD